MTTAISRFGAGTGLIRGLWRDTMPKLLADLKSMQQQQRKYRKTRHELDSLSDRDLCDLGIPRSDISRLAKAASMGGSNA